MPLLVNMCQANVSTTWRIWVDFIMKHRKALGLKNAALIHSNGTMASATSGFKLSAKEVENLKSYFDTNRQQATITLGGKTFIVKWNDQRQLLAFCGTNYYIISRSKTMYIVAVCERKSLCEDAAKFVRNINTKLMEKDY